jgi:hypothetical protein
MDIIGWVKAPPWSNDDEKIANEKLILRLMAGYHVDARGREVTSYIEPDSAEGKQARAALARLVRDSIAGFVGELLALAVDPDTPSAIPGMHPIWTFEFKSPARNKRSTLARDLAVVYFITALTREKRLKPLQAAAAHFGIKYSRLHAIWSQHKKLIAIPTKRVSFKRQPDGKFYLPGGSWKDVMIIGENELTATEMKKSKPKGQKRNRS